MPEDRPQVADGPNDEPNILSFIVRVWQEETGLENPEVIWRGHITLVASGERQYFTDIYQIPALIAAHLNQNR